LAAQQQKQQTALCELDCFQTVVQLLLHVNIAMQQLLCFSSWPAAAAERASGGSIKTANQSS
jgi:hypothetical protein